MKSLDDLARIRSLDASDMGGLIESLPFMARESIKLCRDTKIKIPGNKIENIVIAGMGGSAMSGDIFKNAFRTSSRYPVEVVRGYSGPDFVSSKSLFFALSYSGNTEETLSAYGHARSKKASTVVVSSGGKLFEKATSNGDTVFKVPSCLPPRASLPYLLIPLLYYSEKASVIKGSFSGIGEALNVLDQIKSNCGSMSPFSKNPAKKLAAELYGRFPVILGSFGLSDAASYRWKTQISENAKMISVSNSFPEMDHNEIVNLAQQAGPAKKISVVILREDGESMKMKRRIEITKKIISANIGPIHEVWAKGQNHLSKILSLCYFGDFVSYYLAVLQDIDPTPVTTIERLKKELIKR